MTEIVDYYLNEFVWPLEYPQTVQEFDDYQTLLLNVINYYTTEIPTIDFDQNDYDLLVVAFQDYYDSIYVV